MKNVFTGILDTKKGDIKMTEKKNKKTKSTPVTAFRDEGLYAYNGNDSRVEDPGHKPSGMTLCNCGFTLIELLVVVLIIGILAAVALPQYQNAVLKARFAEVESNLRAIYDATKVYHLATGNWPAAGDLDHNWEKNIPELDIEVPGGECLHGESGGRCFYFILNVYGVYSVAYGRSPTSAVAPEWDFFMPLYDGSAGGANVKEGIIYALRSKKRKELGFTEYVGSAAGTNTYKRP